jgi:hypothetical protein
MYLLFHNITPGYARQTNVLQHANMKKYSTGEGSGQLFCLAVVPSGGLIPLTIHSTA